MDRHNFETYKGRLLMKLYSNLQYMACYAAWVFSICTHEVGIAVISADLTKRTYSYVVNTNVLRGT